MAAAPALTVGRGRMGARLPLSNHNMASSVAFWRQWHRWIGFPAAAFLLWAAATGFLVAFTEFFGAEEALRERTRDLVSPVTLASPAALADPLARAVAAVAARAPGAPVDKAELQFKGDRPTVTVYTGRPTGGEDRRFVVDARTGRIVTEEAYADKPLLYRLHSGEAFGDGGLVFAMAWALALVALTASGLVLWWRVRRRDATGIRRLFW
jgi:uncharacterized iron-regulated membrane protein